MLSSDKADRLVDSCVDTIGNDLRSVVYFTEDDFDQIYLKDYLSAEADIGVFVENERSGFHRRPTHEGSELGRHRYTVQRFEHGYLTRLVVGSHGVFVTTNQLPIEGFDALTAALERHLETWT